MNLLTMLSLAVGLSMDCMAVSIANGLTMKCLRVRPMLRIALFFGGFQMLMPVLGWLAGLSLRSLIAAFDHWLAFALLLLIGGKMIREARRREGSCERTDETMKLLVLVGLAVATSLDALAIGLSLSFLHVAIVTPVLVIGATAFALTLLGIWVGFRFGDRLERYAELVGGLILIGIGLKILVQHLAERG